MHYKERFLQLMVRTNALKFGSFVLKSGRTAPYFFNAGSINSGEALAELASCYAEALKDSGFEVDVLFGPAYKGIPLAVATSVILAKDHGMNLGYTFNRKEAKDHGADAGSSLVGTPLTAETRVVLLDDVITAGTAVRESVDFFKANGNPQVTGIVIALHRMEKNNEGRDALAAIGEEFGIPVFPIVNLDDLIAFLHNKEVDGRVVLGDEQLKAILDYRAEYGI